RSRIAYWPDRTSECDLAQSIANFNSFSADEGSDRNKGSTPQDSARVLAICSVRVRAIIVADGLRLLSATAVRPVSVDTTISGACNCSVIRCAASTAASVIGSIKPDSEIDPPRGEPPLDSRYASASEQIWPIVTTASTGYSPTALSPESMTASVPSRTALNTSLASARVGRLEGSMLLSICVAVITGRWVWLHSAMMRFWIAGTRCTSISTPRSPRATITQSVTAMISSRCSTACGFSILTTTRAGHSLACSSCRNLATSSALRTNDKPTKSTSFACCLVQSRSLRSLSVSDLTANSEPGKFSPCRERSCPASVTFNHALPGSVCVTTMATVPSAKRMVSPSLSSFGNSGYEQVNSRLPFEDRSATSMNSSPSAHATSSPGIGPSRILGPQRSCKIATC